jgi:outer membrane protein assembly factor BamB
MRRLAALVAALALAPAVAPAQQPSSTLFTQSRPLDRDELARGNLRQAFAITLPMESRKDGIATMQLLDDLLIVQLRSGVVAAFDPDTGAVRWVARFGSNYPPVVPLVAADDRYVFVVRDVRLAAFNRVGGQLEWSFEFPTIPSSPPATDGDRLYICIGGNQLMSFNLPLRPGQEAQASGDSIFGEPKKHETKPPPKDARTTPAVAPAGPGTRVASSGGEGRNIAPSIGVVESVIPPYRLNSNTNQRAMSIAVLPSVTPPYRINSEVQSTPSMAVVQKITRLEELSQKNLPPVPIKKAWMLTLSMRVTEPVAITNGPVIIPGTGRELVASPRLKAQEFYKFVASGNITAPLGQFGDTVYVGTLDANFYALDGFRGRPLWRYTTDSPIEQKPMVCGADIYLTTISGQLYRLGREDGESPWKDPTGRDRFATEFTRFVAANDRFVYGIDKAGQLVVVSRDRGNRLHRLDTSSYTHSLANDQTDRLYLASNSGSLICLHDRNLPKAVHFPKRASGDAEAPPPGLESTPVRKAPASKPKPAPADKKSPDDMAKDKDM